MVNDVVKNYSNKFPDEIKKALDGFGHEVRYAILSYLLENKEASFIDIVNNLGLDNSLFRAHVKKLLLSGLVENIIKHGEIREKYSYYQITTYGHNFILNLFKSLEPVKTTEKWRVYIPQNKRKLMRAPARRLVDEKSYGRKKATITVTPTVVKPSKASYSKSEELESYRKAKPVYTPEVKSEVA